MSGGNGGGGSGDQPQAAGITYRHPEFDGALRTLPPPPWPVEGLIARGFLVADKPAGCTSHDVVDRVRRLLRVRKVGHGGTLDPGVTGVLPLGLGQATRFLDLMLLAGKTYDCRMLLHGGGADEATVRRVLADQVGTITQMPPVRSRVKRVERERDIYDLAIAGIDGREVRFTVRCEAGTYIRKLCHDVGVALNVGAHMDWLRRLAAGGFELDVAVTMEALEGAVKDWRGGDPEPLRGMILPPEAVVTRLLPCIWVDEGALPSVGNGAPLALPGVLGYTAPFATGDRVALLTTDGFLVAQAEARMDAATLPDLQKGIVAQPNRVCFPPPGSWPRDPSGTSHD